MIEKYFNLNMAIYIHYVILLIFQYSSLQYPVNQIILLYHNSYFCQANTAQCLKKYIKVYIFVYTFVDRYSR